MQLAARNSTPDWTGVYEYLTGSLGITHVFPIYDRSGQELVAAWAVDMELGNLDAQLQEIKCALLSFEMLYFSRAFNSTVRRSFCFIL